MRLKSNGERRQKGFVSRVDILEICKDIMAGQVNLVTIAENQAQRADKRDCEQ